MRYLRLSKFRYESYPILSQLSFSNGAMLLFRFSAPRAGLGAARVLLDLDTLTELFDIARLSRSILLQPVL